MFRWLFGSRRSADPATEKHLRYAKKLGIDVPKNADKDTLGQLIGKAEARDPSLKAKRGNAKEKQRIRNCGPEKIAEEARWQKLADDEKWMLVVFAQGKSKIAEVVRINGAILSDAGKISIETEVMKIAQDRDIGPHVDAGRYLEIPLDKIEWHEIVDEVEIEDVKRFQKHLERVKARV